MSSKFRTEFYLIRLTVATRSRFKMTQEERKRRFFSEEFKKQKVFEIESKQVTIAEVSKAYQVRRSAIYLWIDKFGSKKKKGERIIVELESDTLKLREAERRIAELERALGQKQLLVDFQEKMITMAEKHYNIDIKKNSAKK